jgi:hypothetical protein
MITQILQILEIISEIKLSILDICLSKYMYVAMIPKRIDFKQDVYTNTEHMVIILYTSISGNVQNLCQWIMETWIVNGVKLLL